MSTDRADEPPVPPGPGRRGGGRGRPYPPGAVAAVRELVETTALRFDEIAARAGVHQATIGRWARRFGWRRGETGNLQRPEAEVPAAGRPSAHDRALSLGPPLRGASQDEEQKRLRAGPRDGDAGSTIRSGPPYGAADHEAARVLIEASRLGLEAIGLRLGIATATLFRWRKRFRWQRPELTSRLGPDLPRYRRRGRPYASDAVGVAQRLVTQTLLSQKRIAAQAGLSQATVSNWIRRRGWTRPEPDPGSHRFAAARRTAPTVRSGDRRGRSYGPDVVAEARRLYRQTELSTALIGARVRVSAVTVARWAKAEGWTRPRDLPEPHGRSRRRRRR